MHWQFGEMEFGEMKRNTSNWSNFCIPLRRASLSASAGLSCSTGEQSGFPRNKITKNYFFRYYVSAEWHYRWWAAKLISTCVHIACSTGVWVCSSQWEVVDGWVWTDRSVVSRVQTRQQIVSQQQVTNTRHHHNIHTRLSDRRVQGTDTTADCQPAAGH